VVHSQGHAVLVESVSAQGQDLSQLQAQCRAGQWDAPQSYTAFDQLGLAYGPRMRALHTLSWGLDEQGQGVALGRLQLGAWSGARQGGYVLHPSVMDAALQASLGLYAGEPGKTALPFAVERVQVLKAVPAQAWAWIRHMPGSGAQQSVQKLDIDVLDEQGQVCVSLQGYSARVMEAKAPQQPAQTLLLQAQWTPQTVQSTSADTAPQYERHIVFMVPRPGDSQELSHFQEHLPQALWVVLQAQGEAPGDRYEALAQQLLVQLQDLMRSKSTGPVLVQLVLNGQDSSLRGLAGMLKSVSLESPKVVWQLVEHDGLATNIELGALLQQQAGVAHVSHEVRCAAGVVQARHLQEVPDHALAVQALSKPGGVYLITGGLGGLGRIFAGEMARASAGVVLVLTGRSALQGEDARVKALCDLGAKVEYWALDVSRSEGIKSLVQGVIHRHGKLDGVIHSAGVLRDGFALKKTAQDLSEVFAPKVKGLEALDKATQGLALDYFVAFSSISGALGNLGQSDYAAANAYMDEYMQARAIRVSQGLGVGRSLSVNWPLWSEGGMQVDEATLQRMRTLEGVEPLSTESGVKALGQALSLDVAQVLVLSGQAERLRQTVLQSAWPKPMQPSSQERQTPSPIKADGEGGAALHDKVQRYLKSVLASGLKLPAERIDSATALEQYGIDSVMAMELVGTLEQKFGSLSKTLFFEYQTIEALAEYLVSEHSSRLSDLIGLVAQQPGPRPALAERVEQPVSVATPSSRVRARQSPRQGRVKTASAPAASTALDIAIIGMSGRYPQARTLSDYWRNLTQGVDCISEIPPERWDAQRWFDPQKGKPGKSYSKWGGFIDGMDEFDPQFFNTSPREAAAMDPQERLFLQCAHATLEDAGYTRHSLAAKHQDRVGVYVGSMYLQYRSEDTVSSYSAIANKVSQHFGFDGPSIAVDTMCSSSTIAIYQACKDLVSGDCELALAGGVNLSMSPRKYVGLSQLELLASHVGSRSFSDGDGYLPAEAVGAVLLKPLSKAIADGDHILAVIKGGASNHSGRSGGYFVPNPQAQARVMAQSLRQAGMAASTLSYVEAAANGSPVGDAVEFAALRQVFSHDGHLGQACAMGSVKSSIGHPEAASGMAQLAKVVLQMVHGQIAPTSNVDQLNPSLKFEGVPLVLQRELADWPRPVIDRDGQAWQVPRRALINSFGAGGSNASLVIEEYVSPARAAPRSTEPQAQAFLFSAKSTERLNAVLEQMLTHVEEHEDVRMDDLAFSLQVCKEEMPVRLGLVASQRDEFINALRHALKPSQDAPVTAIHRGDLSLGLTELQQMLSARSGQEFVSALLELRDLDRLVLYWVHGGHIDWRQSHVGRPVFKVRLPAYPFVRQKCWIPHEEAHASPTAPLGVLGHQRIHQYIVASLSSMLNVAPDQVKGRRPMREYGLESVTGLRLMRDLAAEFGIELRGRDLVNHDTVDALTAYLVKAVEGQGAGGAASMAESASDEKPNDSVTADVIVLHSLDQFRHGLLSVEQMQDILKEAGEHEAA
jgi:3-oxoacyl-(acyl-carrier-protein) synthase/acyl carrier protein/NADP-dependent 3-hydroxy acid dehydrogenase YdfG